MTKADIIFNYDESQAEKFKGIFAVIKADSDNDSHNAWYQYVHKPDERYTSFTDWNQKGGHLMQVGTYKGDPICVVTSVVEINKKNVMFISPSSLVVHFGMVDEWIKYYTEPLEIKVYSGFYQVVGELKGK